MILTHCSHRWHSARSAKPACGRTVRLWPRQNEHPHHTDPDSADQVLGCVLRNQPRGSHNPLFMFRNPDFYPRTLLVPDERNCFVVNKRIYVGSCQKYFLIKDCCTRILLNFLSSPYHRKTVIFTRFLSTKKVQKHWGFSNDVYREILIKFIEEGGCCSYFMNTVGCKQADPGISTKKTF